ncbi:MAG: ABC transporter ATP-binding protein [Calditrichaceae bacterium]|nr:ABC transporter ATP-binding protein [Calditrichaceae bacterium]MBN2710538.1 ABC transporter ATP-binding protein [Calditrichaceae bacterium]RQV96548.1 MAG: ABC transporter ATP-binding protein [Calditrichota bacterium]
MKAILCKQVSFKYPDGTTAVNCIDLAVDKGEKVGIIGPNGAGKSTLLTLLNGVNQPLGDLYINGILVNPKTVKSIRAVVGIAFQNPDDQLFCPTIFDDVAFGPLNYGLDKSQVEHRVQKALMEVGLENYQDRSSIHLSFGERKLASIAAVISMSPEIVAMDEPTGNLDAFHRRKMIQWIQNTNRTCIITSHDLDMIIETCSRVVIMDKGKIAANDKAEKILKDFNLLTDHYLEPPFQFQTQSQGGKS